MATVQTRRREANIGQKKSLLKWHSQNTGEIGPAANELVHFCINKLGLVNVLGYKLAELPEWVQKIMVARQYRPKGWFVLRIAYRTESCPASREHRSRSNSLEQLTHPSNTLHVCIRSAHFTKSPYGTGLFRSIHRFYGDWFEQLCELCKELHRTISERIDIGLLNAKIDPANAEKANKE